MSPRLALQRRKRSLIQSEAREPISLKALRLKVSQCAGIASHCGSSSKRRIMGCILRLACLSARYKCSYADVQDACKNSPSYGSQIRIRCQSRQSLIFSLLPLRFHSPLLNSAHSHSSCAFSFYSSSFLKTCIAANRYPRNPLRPETPATRFITYPFSYPASRPLLEIGITSFRV